MLRCVLRRGSLYVGVMRTGVHKRRKGVTAVSAEKQHGHPCNRTSPHKGSTPSTDGYSTGQAIHGCCGTAMLQAQP